MTPTKTPTLAEAEALAAAAAEALAEARAAEAAKATAAAEAAHAKALDEARVVVDNYLGVREAIRATKAEAVTDKDTAARVLDLSAMALAEARFHASRLAERAWMARGRNAADLLGTPGANGTSPAEVPGISLTVDTFGAGSGASAAVERAAVAMADDILGEAIDACGLDLDADASAGGE